MLDWKTSNGLIDYKESMLIMEQRVSDIIHHDANELVWFLEHKPVYTAGSSAKDDELLSNNFEIVISGRGGKYTYHGPNQLICYVMLNLGKRKIFDLKKYVFNLEEWIIATLDSMGVVAKRCSGRIGVWVDTDNNYEAKIAAIGIRVKKWVTYHGFAINIDPDLSHYQGIIPCGISEYGVTSLKKIGFNISRDFLIESLKENFYKIF